MNKKEAVALYQKYLKGDCTPEEITLLQTAFNRYLESREAMPSQQQILDSERQMKQAIYERIPDFPAARKRSWYRYAVAAMVLLGLLAGYMVWQGKVSHTLESPLVQHRIEPHLMPGANKATLTLTDGQVIDLSTDQEGIVVADEIRYADGTMLSEIDSQKKVTEEEQGTGKPALKYLTLHTPKGGEYRVRLEDGSLVWLNAESTLQYPLSFNGADRVVKIQGEAYFEVVHDERPFTVVTDLGEIQVHGTAFNVKAYPEEQSVQTTLVTGSVSFATMRMRVNMQPGELAVADISGQVETRKVDVAERIGWKNGLYIFRERRLEDIMRELARWYDFNIRYESEAVKNIAFTGNLKRYGSINDFLKLLKRTGEIEYRIEGKELVLYRK